MTSYKTKSKQKGLAGFVECLIHTIIFVQTYNHNSLLNTLPWILFQLAEHVSEPGIARRFLEEFRVLTQLEDDDSISPPRGKEPKKLLKRLLQNSNNFYTYSSPTLDIVQAEIRTSSSNPFISSLLDSLSWLVLAFA